MSSNPNLQCPGCGRNSTLEDAQNINQGVISCSECDTEYHIDGKNINPEDRTYKHITEIPEGMWFDHDTSALLFRLMPIQQKKSFRFNFLIIFLIIASWEIFDSGILNSSDYGWLFATVLWGLPVILLLPYFRYQVIEVSPDKIQVRHSISIPVILSRPLKTFPTRTFRQLFVREQVTNGRIYYQLWGYRDGMTSEVLIIDEIPTLEAAYFIEQETEAFAGINDKAVRSEFDTRRTVEKSYFQKLMIFKKLAKNTMEERRILNKGNQTPVPMTLSQNMLGVLVMILLSAGLGLMAAFTGNYIIYAFAGIWVLFTTVLVFMLIKRLFQYGWKK